MKKNSLLVPIEVQAIFQSEDRAVVGPEMDFESLPYFDQDQKQDMNPSLPYLAESIIPRPFEDCEFLLKKGVHLNWDFPDFLKRSKIGAASPTEFPPVPTRWLIARYNGDALEKQWIIESDALLQDLRGAKFMDMAQTSLKVDIHSCDGRPYTYMGRVEELPDWIKRNKNSGDRYTNWLAVQNEPLTAMGWGSPSFDTFYPNCRGVFGFHDPEITEENSILNYKVLGWYGDEKDDYWNYYLAKKEAQITSVLEHLNGLSHLDSEAKIGHAKEAIEKMIADDVGVALDLSPYFDTTNGKVTVSIPAQGMVCHGEISLETQLEAPLSNPLFAIGNTPTEALSALIVAEQFKDRQDLERKKLEDTFEAILMGDRLKSLKADIGPKFREYRHADEFYGTDGGISWAVQLVDDNPNKDLHGDPHAEQKPLPTLPESSIPLLEALNKSQKIYDRTLLQLESLRTELYADWYRYMHCAYPPPGETEEYLEVSEIRAMIENGSLKRFTIAKENLGDELTYEPEDLRKPAQSNPDYSGQVREAWQALNLSLDIEHQKAASEAKQPYNYHWEIHHNPAPRFWESTPPAVVVAIPKPKPEGSSAQGGTSEPYYQFFDKTLSLEPTSFNVKELLETSKAATGSELTQSQNNDLFKAEWEVEVFPVAAMHPSTRSHGEYDPLFMLNNYFLGENEPDFDDDPCLAGSLALVKTASIYTGSAYINQNLDDRYRTLLQTYLDLQSANQKEQDTPFLDETKKAKEFLSTHDLLVVTLNGFNASLLQMHQSVQLNPADPLGFDDYQCFAKKMAAVLPSSKGYSPDPHAVFMPIRSGSLRLLNLRMVDSFGRFVEFTPDAISTPLSYTIPDHPDWVRLPPRLSQAARFNFRFLQSETQAVDESQSAKATSPVCGWIVPNLLDQSLVFFQEGGKNIGEINQNGEWKTIDGTEPSGYLLAVKNWLTHDKDFLNAFLDDIEEAMDNIHPNDREGQSAFSVLMGRPMAVVRMGVQLELKGLPAINMGWNEFRKDVRRNDRETDGFEQVKFPYRIGEYRQQNDGLIGYWTIKNNNQLSDNFNVNDSISATIVTENIGTKMDDWLSQKNEDWKLQDANSLTLIEYLKAEEDNPIKKQDLIQPYIREGSRVWEALLLKGWLMPELKYNKISHYADAEKLSIAPADEMQQFVGLMDPFGVVHLTSGIQPVKSIQLPELFVKNALRNMEVSFLTAPVLGPEAAIELSLPKEQEYTWYWEEENVWPHPKNEDTTMDGKTILAEKDLAPFRTIANFPDRNVLREGRLLLRQKLETGSEASTQYKSN